MLASIFYETQGNGETTVRSTAASAFTFQSVTIRFWAGAGYVIDKDAACVCKGKVPEIDWIYEAQIFRPL